MIKKLALLAQLSLTACANQVGRPDFLSEQTDVAFGAAVNQNIAAQTVNPDGASGDVEASGARVGKAVAAYQADKVEKPRAPGTLTIQASGGEGGGKGGDK